MYGLYGLKHHTVEMLPCGTDGRRTREDKATQPFDAGRLSFAIFLFHCWFIKRPIGLNTKPKKILKVANSYTNTDLI